MRVLSLVLLLSLSFAGTAAARSNRMAHIPNGAEFSCDSCHGRASLQVADLTPFGRDVNRTMVSGVVQWQQIWNLDSDGDGFSNGLELGDPNGQWRRGDTNPVAPIANPGVPNGGICNNGVLEDGEECETGDTQACGNLGAGTIVCQQCRWDSWGCGTCGDGFLNPLKEECDRDVFGTRTCADFGFLSGELTCNDRCRVEPTMCNDEAPAVCGDNVLSRGEQCDGDLFGEVDCARLNFAGGTLLCDACKWDASQCIPKAYEDWDPDDFPDDSEDPEDPGVPDAGELDGDGDVSSPGEGGGCGAPGTPSLVALLFAGFVFLRRRS
jgi:hypothetical protein